MKIDGQWVQSIQENPDGSIKIIDQRSLPHQLKWVDLKTPANAEVAIKAMWCRGAPLLAMVGAYGLCFALEQAADDAHLQRQYDTLLATRPTAVNLRWALNQIRDAVKPQPTHQRAALARKIARRLCQEDVQTNKAIGLHGLQIFQDMAAQKKAGEPINVLTHCNAGWLATIDWGTALAPIYMAYDDGIPVHVWVDETRPRNQGAQLTAWELGQHGVPHTVIADNTGGHLMQHGMVDLCITGTDRVTASGDVCNKIGTYLKALAAKDNHVPFYVALPYTTIDWTIDDGVKDIPIEQRSEREVTHVQGGLENDLKESDVVAVRVMPKTSKAANYAFDVTPNRLVTGLITEQGICAASQEGLAGLYHPADTQS